MVYSWLRRHELLVNTVAALALLTCCVVLGLVTRSVGAYYLFSSLLLLPLTVRRRWPVGCAATVFVVALVQWLTIRGGVGALPADLAVPVAIHALTAYGPVSAGRLGLLAGIGGAALGGVSWPRLLPTTAAHVLLGAFLGSTVVAAWALGRMNRVRRAELATLAERTRLLEVERDLAVLTERTRIAREMHDIVAHSLSVVIAQADGGRYAAESAGTALATIGDHARKALADTRRVLGVLRDGPGEEITPQPGIADIRALVDQVRATGMDVALTLPEEPVEQGLAMVVYRIVQEGLTNVIKHAGTGASADIAVRHTPGRLEVEVRDDGHAPPSPAAESGYGLIGMRERASIYGGEVTLEPRHTGGRILRATIPMPS